MMVCVKSKGSILAREALEVFPDFHEMRDNIERESCRLHGDAFFHFHRVSREDVIAAAIRIIWGGCTKEDFKIMDGYIRSRAFVAGLQRAGVFNDPR